MLKHTIRKIIQKQKQPKHPIVNTEYNNEYYSYNALLTYNALMILQNTLVQLVSGGESKRVSITNELLINPSILFSIYILYISFVSKNICLIRFLDEPTRLSIWFALYIQYYMCIQFTVDWIQHLLFQS